MKTILILLLLCGNALLFTQGQCKQTEEITSAATVALWNQHCKKCHAADGSGSTKIGRKFGARDYTDPAVQASFTDDEIISITKQGVFDEHGKKRMPAYDKKFTDAEIEALIPVIRSFANE